MLEARSLKNSPKNNATLSKQNSGVNISWCLSYVCCPHVAGRDSLQDLVLMYFARCRSPDVRWPCLPLHHRVNTQTVSEFIRHLQFQVRDAQLLEITWKRKTIKLFCVFLFHIYYFDWVSVFSWILTSAQIRALSPPCHIAEWYVIVISTVSS